MKFQYLAVIFVIIILPITLVLSFYAQTQIDIINEQTMYTTKLNNATSSAVMAFQINTTNSHYSSISDSKIRDIEASVNTFYNSLTADLNYTKDELKAYVPAIVYTLYDGYYIYGKRVNAYELDEDSIDETGNLNSMKILKDSELNEKTEYEYGLKPFVYYSCRYTGNNGNDFVVNYTLDNFISIYGNVYDKEKGKLEYVTKSGYLINPNNWNDTSYKGANISKSETLKENIRFNDGYSEIDIGNNQKLTINDGEYQYIIYKNQKIYISGDNYFWYDRGDAILVNSEDTKSYIASHKNSTDALSTDALDYYKSASKFSKWVNENLGSINKSSNVKSYNDGKNLKYDTGKEPIFNMTNQDPEDPSSVFNQHRMAVIRAAIETNLIAAINSYNSNASSYAYALPQLEEEEWENVTNNVCMISFMQGLPMGGKYFNNYVVIPNDKNNEFVDTDSIYLIGSDGCYHMPNCPELVEGRITATGGYINSSFERQTIVKSEKEEYYYKHTINGKAYTGCYHCIVEPSSKYKLQDIIDNKVTGSGITNLRNIYMTVLAREKYNLYKTNNNEQLNLE